MYSALTYAAAVREIYAGFTPVLSSGQHKGRGMKCSVHYRLKMKLHWKRRSRRADQISSKPTRAASSPVRPSPGSWSNTDSGSAWMGKEAIMITGSSSGCGRSVKYEEVYLKVYQDGREARIGLGNYFRFYNTERPHQALGYRTPAPEAKLSLTLT